MKDFIIFFHGHEGSSATVSQLKKLDNIDIIGFEPFDANKKPLISKDIKKIFTLIFNKNVKKNYIEAINPIYKYYYKRDFPEFDKSKSVGFKMRIKNLHDILPIAKKHNVVVFILFRHNILKWAISKCRPNSYQFKLVKGQIQENPPLNIDFNMLDKKIEECKKLHEQKKMILNRCIKDRLRAYPIYYEYMNEDKEKYFGDILDKIGITLSPDELSNFIAKQNYFKKVHSDNLEDFVINYNELLTYVKKNNLEDYL